MPSLNEWLKMLPGVQESGASAFKAGMEGANATERDRGETLRTNQTNATSIANKNAEIQAAKDARKSELASLLTLQNKFPGADISTSGYSIHPQAPGGAGLDKDLIKRSVENRFPGAEIIQGYYPGVEEKKKAQEIYSKGKEIGDSSVVLAAGLRNFSPVSKLAASLPLGIGQLLPGKTGQDAGDYSSLQANMIRNLKQLDDMGASLTGNELKLEQDFLSSLKAGAALKDPEKVARQFERVMAMKLKGMGSKLEPLSYRATDNTFNNPSLPAWTDEMIANPQAYPSFKPDTKTIQYPAGTPSAPPQQSNSIFDAEDARRAALKNGKR